MALDVAWAECWRRVAPLLGTGDRVLLPAGEWPDAAPVRSVRFYGDRIELGDASVLILHKGRIGGMDRAALAAVCAGWRLLHVDAVFACFARDAPDRWAFRLNRRSRHFRPVRYHLDPAAYRRAGATLFFLHVPKTAGTTAWTAVARTVRAKAYYDSNDAFRAAPPRAGTFDLVGGHVFLSAMAAVAGPEDRIACVLRDPVRRFRSAFLHARRPGEDGGTFTPTMRLMRELPLHRFLEHPDARIEANLQLMMLGAPADGNGGTPDGTENVARAMAAAGERRHLFGTAEDLPGFVDRCRALVGLQPWRGELPRLNAAEAGAQEADVAEFRHSEERVRALAAPEVALYERVLRRRDGVDG